MADFRSLAIITVLVSTLTVHLTHAFAQTNSGRPCQATCERGTITATSGCEQFPGTRCEASGCIPRLVKATLLGACMPTRGNTAVIGLTETYELAQKEAWCDSTALNYQQTATNGSYLRTTDSGGCTLFTQGADPAFPRCSQSPFAILGTNAQGTQRVCCLRQCSGDPAPVRQPVVPAPPPPGRGPILGAPIVGVR